MPRSCKCILDRMVFKGTMSEEERDKIMRNLKGTDKVLVVQLDCLMGKDRMAAFRKSLLDQMKDSLVIIPPWAHVAYVGDECTIEIKEEKNAPTKGDKMARQILADIADMSVNDDINAIAKRIIFGERDNVAILSDIRSGYNCFDIDEQPKYRALSIAIEALKERKTGKWILVEMGDTDLYKCSLCANRKTHKSPFCPNCGAKMEEENENSN